jgi:serine/threonine protein kinase
MSVLSTAELFAALRDNRLLDADQLQDLERTLAGPFRGARAVADDLVRRGWLTPYQVEHLLDGRAAELAAGPYRILDCLGQGGVSQVFKAWDTRRGRLVALKMIRPEYLTDPETTGRFQREILAVSRLAHPNIIQNLDADDVGHTHYFAMEYVEGTDLGKLVQQRGPLPIGEACDYIRQAALGLQHAHERGLVHRDIKPANLFLTSPDKVVKVLDLGLARLPRTPGARSTTWTRQGSVIGTPDYLAPEQARNARSVDIRADIYSLGCTLYYLLAGQTPFPGKSLMQKLLDHQMKLSPPIEFVRPDVPQALAVVVRKLMAKKPADRYQIPAEAADALAAFCPGLAA